MQFFLGLFWHCLFLSFSVLEARCRHTSRSCYRLPTHTCSPFVHSYHYRNKSLSLIHVTSLTFIRHFTIYFRYGPLVARLALLSVTCVLPQNTDSYTIILLSWRLARIFYRLQGHTCLAPNAYSVLYCAKIILESNFSLAELLSVDWTCIIRCGESSPCRTYSIVSQRGLTRWFHYPTFYYKRVVENFQSGYLFKSICMTSKSIAFFPSCNL